MVRNHGQSNCCLYFFNQACSSGYQTRHGAGTRFLTGLWLFRFSLSLGGRSNRTHPYKFCTYCNTNNHYINECRNKKRDEARGKESTAAMAFGHPETKVYEDTNTAFVGCLLAHPKDSWFADSGATQHMTDQRSIFKTFTSTRAGSWMVIGIGSSRLSVKGHGDIDFIVTINGTQRAITIKGVLYVPDLSASLLSIAAVTDVGLRVHFIETRVTFSNRSASGLTRVFIIFRSFLLNSDSTRDSASLAVPSASLASIWHYRLAHVSYITIRVCRNFFLFFDFATNRP